MNISNCYKLLSADLLQTNKFCRKMAQLFLCKAKLHPSISKCINLLQKEKHMNHIKIEQLPRMNHQQKKSIKIKVLYLKKYVYIMIIS